jgi:hypothetical protein
MAILKTIAQWLLLPLIKDAIKFVMAKLTLWFARKKHAEEVKDAVNESVNTQDQRPIERIVSKKPGEYSGRGDIVSDLPGVRKQERVERSDLVK